MATAVCVRRLQLWSKSPVKADWVALFEFEDNRAKHVPKQAVACQPPEFGYPRGTGRSVCIEGAEHEPAQLDVHQKAFDRVVVKIDSAGVRDADARGL